MKRRQFLGSVLAGGALFLPKKAAASPLQKGVHLTPTFDATLINSLGLDCVVGTDAVVMDTYNGDAGYLNALHTEYIARIPDDFNAGIVANLRMLGVTKWEIGNEPNLYGVTPQQAAEQFSSAYQLIWSVSPSPSDYFCLSAGAQTGNPQYLDAVLGAMYPLTLGWIDAIGVHYYPATLDPQEVYRFLRMMRGVMNRHGLNDCKVWLTEIGFDDTVWTVAQVASYIPNLWVLLATLPWLERVHWYLAQSDVNHYVGFGTNKLNAAGKAWRDL